MDPTQNSSSPNPARTINRTFEERDTEKIAKEQGLGYVDIERFPINLDVLKHVDEKDAREAQLIPFYQSGKKLRVAVVHPEKKEAKSLIEELRSQSFEPQIYLCSASGLEVVFELYASQLINKKTITTREHFEENDESTFEEQSGDISDLQQKLENLPAKIALNEIEIAAVKARASDIHFQPAEKSMIVRFRIDGVLHDMFQLSKETAQALLLRIKYEGGMKSNIKDAPQDGHATLIANNRKIDLRISTLPTPTIESVVIRILDSYKGIRTFSELGFSKNIQDIIQKALRARNGLILTTGPTGSGKTTTLYSMLAELNTPDQKLVTLEDPIEYHLSGVSQSQVDEKHEYNFENGLKALLRHDPDIILVGEIRSIATAKLASEAALTGHIVLSSLHTNSAVGAITRLRNMGMEDFNIAPTINAVFAQRLVRKVCQKCLVREALTEHPTQEKVMKALVKNHPKAKIPEQIPVAKGCEHCSHTGYSGQTAVCEAFAVDDTVRQMILKHKSQEEITAYLRKKHGFISLVEDGLMKVSEGLTTFEEVQRVTSA